MRLWDLYNVLLTPTQQDITNLFFNFDLTLSEIAEQKGITKQGVSDCLKSCRKQLEEYENKLRFAEFSAKRDLEVSLMLKDAERWADDFLRANPESEGDVRGLKEVLGRDYSKAAAAAVKSRKTETAL